MDEVKYLMSYDNEGNIIGFYPVDGLERYAVLPTQVIPITEEKHQFYIDNDGKYKIDPVTFEDVLKEIIIDVSKLPITFEQRISELELLVLQLGGVI